MKTITPTELRGNVYNILDQVLDTGVPVEIRKGKRRLKIVPVEQQDKLQNLVKRPGFIQGDPEDIIEMNWEKEVNLDLP